jgi:predicted nucleotidyltransferase
VDGGAGMSVDVSRDLVIDFGIEKKVGREELRYVHRRRQLYLGFILDEIVGKINIKQLWIFGSAISYNHFPWSDLDVMVISDGDPDTEVKCISKACVKASKHDTWNKCKDVDILWYRPEEFKEQSEIFGHICWNIRKYGLKYFDRMWFGEQ